MAQFDDLLATLELHIEKKTTNFCELSVQGPMQCFVRQDEVDHLSDAILDLAFACTVVLNWVITFI